MANQYAVSVPLGGGGTGSLIFSWWLYQAYSDEEYLTNPQLLFDYTYKTNNPIWGHDICNSADLSVAGTGYGGRAAISIEEFVNTGRLTIHTRPSFLTDNAPQSGERGFSRNGPDDIVMTPYSSASNWPLYNDFYQPQIIEANVVVQTNIPIFEHTADAKEYIQFGDNIASAINNRVPEVQGRYFEIINIWTEGTWDANGFTPATGATEHYRCLRGRYDDERGIVMWPEPGINDGGLIYSIVNTGSAHDMQYSEDGITWHDTSTFPYNYFYRPRVDEVGTFKFALTFYTNRIPIFADEDTAGDYTNGDAEITDAINYPEISNNYPGSDADIENKTGDPDDGTDWGSVYTESFFHNIYLLGSGGVREISNALYDTSPNGIWEDIKKGLDMFGDNPIEAVMGFMYFPLDLDSVFTNTSNTTHIHFGGYDFVMQNHTANEVIYPQGYFICGSVKIEPTFNNWRDIKAMRIFVDLPYCGRYELDPQKYIGKTIKVIYYIDLYTGACIACLVEGGSDSDNQGICLDQYNGIIAQKLPITLTDFAGHANAMINTFLGGGGQAITAGQSIGETGAHAAIGAASGGGAALALGGAALGAAGLGAVTAAKTVYGLQMNNINKFNQTRGGSTGMLNQYVNQRPTFIFIYPEADIPNNFNAMYGTPSNAGGSISQFYGYFEADTVRLNMPGATESEKAKARNLLMNGIYIQ